MATTIEKFDSTGGFAVGKTVVVDELRNAKDLNTLQFTSMMQKIASLPIA